MRSPNLVRVLGCGLLAGLAAGLGEFPLNRLFLGVEWENAMRSLNRPPLDSVAILSLLESELGLGVLLMWLYAVTRPRFGNWFRAAVAAGLTVWLLAYVIGFGWSYAMGVFSAKIYWTTLAWTLFEIPAAAVLGAWVYERLSPRRSIASPEDCASLDQVRAEIDRIDEGIVGLLGERCGYVKAAARFKSSQAAIAAPERIRTMLKARRGWARQEGLDPDTIEAAYRLLVDQFGRFEAAQWQLLKPR